MTEYFIALAATVATEVLLIWVMRRAIGGAWPGLTEVVLINLFTHPAANLAVFEGALDFWQAEVLVVAVESLLLRGLGCRPGSKALLASVIANAATAALSFVF